MNILFLITENPKTLRYWSGTGFYIYKTLSKEHHVTLLGLGMLMQGITYSRMSFCFPRRIDYYNTLMSKLCSERIKQMPNIDLIFFGDIYISPALEVDVPIIHLTDTSFEHNNYIHPSKDQGFVEKLISLEKHTFSNSNQIIITSEWISNRIHNTYFIPNHKLSIIEFGANIPNTKKYQIRINTSLCHIVFIGRHWEKKGGNIAFEAIRILQNQGFPCKMTFIGCAPPTDESLPQNTEIIPFLDKSKPEELERLCSILYDAHFLLLPTRFDAFGIVFAEASAYGVPSIATDVGGTSQAIREGKNGFLLPLEAGAEEYANKIKDIFADKESYYQLRRTSRKEYETRLNWDVWLKRVNKVFEETVSNYKKQNNKNE